MGRKRGKEYRGRLERKKERLDRKKRGKKEREAHTGGMVYEVIILYLLRNALYFIIFFLYSCLKRTLTHTAGLVDGSQSGTSNRGRASTGTTSIISRYNVLYI